MKLFEYNNQTFMVPDTVCWAAWNSDGEFYLFSEKPVKIYDYTDIDLNMFNGFWSLQIYETYFDGDDFIYIYDYSLDTTFLHDYNYDIGEQSLNDGYYEEWNKYLIDIDSICTHIDGIEEL